MKIKFKAALRGYKKFKKRLVRAQKRLQNKRKMWFFVGQHMLAHYQQNLSSGVDPHGKPLAEVERWTRKHRVGIGKRRMSSLTPLVASGGLRANMALVKVTKKEFTIGFRGKYSRIVSDIRAGAPGRMSVKPGSVRTARDGHQYIRVKSNAGQFYTKQVVGGKVRVDPKVRDFFFIGPRQARMIKLKTAEWIARNLWK